jgi:hypothetical protein
MSNMPFALRSATLAATLSATSVAAAVEPVELPHSDPHDWQEYGYDVAVSGDYAVVGAPYHDGLGEKAGEAYVWKLDGSSWTLLQTLASEAVHTPEEYDYFGTSVAIDGDVIAVWHVEGGPEEHSPGLVETFRLNSETELFASSGVLEGSYDTSGAFDDMVDDFGYSMAIDGNTLAVGGGYFSWTHNAWCGQIWIFTWDGASWSEAQRFVNASPTAFDGFGGSVDLDGDLLVAGAADRTTPGDGAGVAFIFERYAGVFSQTDVLLDPEGSWTDQFGIAVAVSGTVIAVGDPKENHEGSHEGGAVCVYEQVDGIWTLCTTLQDCRGVGGNLGSSVALDGNVLVAGAPGYTDDYSADGAVMTFERQSAINWPQTAHLESTDPTSGAYLGASVAVDGDVLIAGEPGHVQGNGDDSGNVLAWHASWVQDADLDTVPDWYQLANGDSHDWDGNCIPDEADCLGDITGDSWQAPDGVVDVRDLTYLIDHFGQAGSGSAGAADLDEDDRVTMNDLIWMLLTWGECP